MIEVTLPDGSKKQYKKPITGVEIAKSISDSLAKEALAIIQARPELIGSKGTVALYGQAALDIMRSWAGKQTFQKFFSDINRDKTQFMNNQKELVL